MDAMINFLMGFSGPAPYLLVFFILLACGLGLPIPEDITLFAAGVLAYYGSANVYWMIVISFVGVMLGDSLIFMLGAKYGRRITHRWPFRKFLTHERLDQVSERLRKGGNRVIFMARFMPGLRAPIFFSSGMLHVPFRVFFFYDGLAALLSVPAIVYTVFYFGDELEQVVSVIRNVQHGILLVIGAVILFFVVKWLIKRKVSTRS